MSSRRKPEWLKMRPPSGERFTDIKETLRDNDLHTVCEEASCPNMGSVGAAVTAPARRRSC